MTQMLVNQGKKPKNTDKTIKKYIPLNTKLVQLQ